MSAPASWGAPADEGAVAQSPTLALTDLGSASSLAFYGSQDTQMLTVPVPKGLTPASLNAVVELPVNPRPGMITVTQNERTISRVNLPTTDQAPIVIPLLGAQVIDNSVTVTLRAYLLPSDGYCLDPTNPLRLINGTVSYAGDEQPPVAVADFLPPVLRKLTVFLPRSPSETESDAAVQLATAVVAHYGKQDPEIVVVPLVEGQAAPLTPSLPLERQIVIKEGLDSGLSIHGGTGVPWLLVSGPSGELKNQAELLFSDLSRLAFASKAVVGLPKTNHQPPGNVTALRELGVPGVNAIALAPQVSIGLDQTRFGRSVHAIRVHLQGSYSPVPADIGGQISAAVNGETIDHWSTDDKGVIDHWVEVPDRLLQRFTSLSVSLNVSTNTGRCGDFHTIGAGDRLLSLAIDGGSTVETSPATPPLPGGLQSVPQTLMPRVQVGIGVKVFDDTVRAVAILAGLQRVSALPIDTAVMSVQKAIDSPDPAILISADGWNNPDIPLPVSASSDGPITVNTFASSGKPATIALDPNLKFGSLQTIFDGKRSLLIATSNGAPAQLDFLLTWLNRDRERWVGLDGVAVVSAPGRDPVIVTATAGPVTRPGDQTEQGWLWWFGGGVLAVVAVGVVAIVGRARRGSPDG